MFVIESEQALRMPQDLSIHLQRGNTSFPSRLFKFVFFVSLMVFYFKYFHQEEEDGMISKGAGQNVMNV